MFLSRKMSLAISGDYKKVKKLRNKAEKAGLEVIYFSDSPDFLKQFNSALAKTGKKWHEEIIESSTRNEIGMKTAEILHTIKIFGKIRPYEIAKEVSMRPSAIIYHLKILQEKDLIERYEKGKKEVYYKLVE